MGFCGIALHPSAIERVDRAEVAMKKLQVLSCVIAVSFVAAETRGQTTLSRGQTPFLGSGFSASVGSGARALAMGGAFIAIADDSTASSWNPAGLCVLERPEASVVVQAGSSFTTDFSAFAFSDVLAPISLTESDSASQFKATGTTLDFASVTYPFRVGSLKLVPQFNYQRVTNFSLTPSIPNLSYSGSFNAPGLFDLAYQGATNLGGSGSGGLDVYAISLGVSANPRIYIGVAFNLWRKGAQLSRATNLSESDTFTFPDGSSGQVPFTSARTLNVTSTFKGTSVNVGLLVKPIDQLHIGAVYKSRFNMSYTSSTTDVTNGNSSVTGSTTDSTSISDNGTVRWPQTFGFGLAVLPTDVLTLSADFTTSNWSNATYNVTRTRTDTPSGQPPTTTTTQGTELFPTLADPNQPEQAGLNTRQVDTQQFRFGAEYAIKKPGFMSLVALPLRAGAFTDRQLYKDTAPGLGNVNFYGVTGGFGLVWSHFTLDFAYVHESGSFRSGDFSETFPSGEVVSHTADAQDKFHSNQFYASTTVRF
jgi:long-subunit fatty acid transport protein